MGLTTKILGWSTFCEPGKATKFAVRLESEYSEPLIRKYIQRGEYRCDVPFNLYKCGNELILEAERKPTILTVSNNPATSVEECRKEMKCSTAPSGVLAVTHIYDVLDEEGYIRPMEAQSLVGKSKGYTSRTDNPKGVFEYRVLDSSMSFAVCQAESFELVGRKTGEDLVLYDPRHEIFELRYGISSRGILPDELVNSEIMQRTVGSVVERFASVSSTLERQPRGSVRFSILDAEPLHYLGRPDLVLPTGEVVQLSSEQNLRFGDAIRPRVDPSVDSFKITVAVDSGGLRDEQRTLITQFVTELSDWVGTDIEAIWFNDILACNEITSDCCIVILNDYVPGHGGLHDRMKSHVDRPTKMLNLSSIAHEKWDRVLPLLWLGLRARLRLALFQRICSGVSPPFVGISLSPLMRGEYLVLSAVSVIGDKISSKRLLVHRLNEFEPQQDHIIEDLLVSILGKSTSDTSAIVAYVDDVSLGPVVDRICLESSYSAVNVRHSGSVMLTERDGTYETPIDGQYSIVSDTQYLLTTNGRPDAPEKGIPSPVYVEIVTSGKASSYDVLKEIYYQTFLHPASLTKTKLPLPLYLSEQGAVVGLVGWNPSAWSSEELII